MLNASIDIQNNKEYGEIRELTFTDERFAHEVATVNNGQVAYRFEIFEQHLICYIEKYDESRKLIAGEEIDKTDLILDSPGLKDFIANVIDFVLADMEA